MSPHLCRFAGPPALLLALVLAACSSGSSGGGNGGGSSSSSGSGGGSGSSGGSGSGSGGGTCPIVLPTAQVPFGSMPCSALTAADFMGYGATLTQAQSSFGGTGCNYLMSYAPKTGGGGANVIVAFKPGCWFATDESTLQSEAAAYADGGGSGADITMVQQQSGIGDAAFTYLNAGESNVEFQHGGLAVVVTSSVCSGQTCMGTQGLVSAIAFAKLIVSRY
jgi:hypothetical protein